jgi:putative ABC transport system ATP-binding protein
MIRTRALRKVFTLDGQEPIEVLRGLDLDVSEGEFVSLLGPSGSGKSTLLAILAGLDSPTSGEVTVAGNRLDGLDEESLTRFRRDHLGFIFQSYHLVPTLSALENVALPLELRGEKGAPERARALLEEVGLGHRAGHLPRQLSGGEQQRVAIARALAPRPRLIFADEPTGNLDSANGERVFAALLALRGRATVVMVSHDERLAARADRVIRLQDGRLADAGGPTA